MIRQRLFRNDFLGFFNQTIASFGIPVHRKVVLQI